MILDALCWAIAIVIIAAGIGVAIAVMGLIVVAVSDYIENKPL